MKILQTQTSYEAEIEALKIANIKLSAENQELRALNAWYMEQFKLAQQLRFGKSSEQNVLTEQMGLF